MNDVVWRENERGHEREISREVNGGEMCDGK
jgi:hypothetical protein